MVIISKAIVRDFYKKYPDSEIALLRWYEDTKASSWKSFTEVKKLSILLMLWGMIDMYLILRATIIG